MDDDAADQFQGQTARQDHSDGRGKRGRGGRGGGRGGQSRERELSHALSRLLRHQALNAGITLDREGYAPLDKVLQWGPIRVLAPTFHEIQSAVRDSDKQRFTLKAAAPEDSASPDPADWLIRANQGHSIRLESNEHLTPLAVPGADGSVPPGSAPVPETVVHGTYFAYWPEIVASGGLKAMGRTHVHCSTGLPGPGSSVISGMRGDAELLVYVDVARSISEGGLQWWVSDNGVVLSEGGGEDGVVPAKFFKEVCGRNPSLVGVLWKDGEKVADLPEGLNVRIPAGKGQRGQGQGRGRGRGRGRGGRGQAKE